MASSSAVRTTSTPIISWWPPDSAIDASFSTTLDNGGASQILSIILAVMAIEAGLATTVMCGYGRDSWSRTHVKRRGYRAK